MKTIDFEAKCKKIKLLLFDCDGVLTDGRIILGSSSIELKFFSAMDGMGIKLWRDAGYLAGCITGRYSEALERRAKELKFDELHQSIGNKGAVLDEVIKRHGLTLEQVAYVGDDVNDLPVGTRVGLFFVPANHHSFIRPYADYCLTASGGHGAVREVVDLILEQQGRLGEVVSKSYIG
jgi:3-deoxy-D-manno-octulosonate 8-phosphate phosphatase (KDO 8-P phosphatase)